MIKKLILKVPEYNVDVTQEFGKHTLIEAPNGYGKTTALHCLMSIYTGKFRTSKIPACTATVETDEGNLILNKGLWVGKQGEPNPIARYVLAGEFFDMDTSKQRLAIVQLLGIDREAFMKKHVADWTEDLEKDLKKTMTFNQGKEAALLEDIVKLRNVVIEYEKNPVIVSDNSSDIERAYRDSIKDAVAKYDEAVKHNAKIVLDKNNHVVHIDIAERKIQELLEQYNDAIADLNCSSCGQPMPKEKRDAIVEEIRIKGSKARAELDTLKAKTFPDPVEVPERPADLTIEEKAKVLGLEIVKTSQDELRRKAEYESAKTMLASKEEELKSLGELDTKDKLELIAKTKKAFTAELNVAITELGMDIELFKTQANGEVVESFIVSKDGVPYSDLSNGNKAVIQFRMAKAFAKKLGVPFVLIDEAGTLSGESLKAVLSESEGIQVIMARATPFAKKEVK